ncbi:hypothetical protein [Spirosoma aerolatum]|uniref:hypothetical protein n=1 Tax=Spirosoma aerolatum TaxID=1211326 RepID=UPI0009AE1C6B|nr:hypothetical protein [Spirosoma aerolatum]
MKPKPDEMPDEWVRQTLRRLPDAPPPGSSFDSERLWTQLRPELQPTGTRQSFGWMRWGIAACLIGLLFVWYWVYPSVEKQSLAANGKTAHKTRAATKLPFKQNLPTELTQPNVPTQSFTTALPAGTTATKAKTRVPEPVEAVPTINEIAAMPSPRPDLDMVVETVAVVEKPLIPLKRNVADLPAKRRFRIVHQNELRAEEEARPKLYSTENFVRLGTGQRAEPLSDDHRPALVMPLTNKPNQ